MSPIINNLKICVMKIKSPWLSIAIVAVIAFIVLTSLKSMVIKAKDIEGAWEYGPADKHTVMIATDQIFSVVTYDGPGKKMISSFGGKWRIDGNKLLQTIEWNNTEPQQVGKELTAEVAIKGGKLMVGATKEIFTRIDDGKGDLNGAWIITGSYENDKVNKRPNAFFPRRTMKILSGSRFHWIAYNVQSKQFMNAGGGDYTAKDGKYTEHIEFFTKTPESVGKTVSFQYEFVDGDWRHKGQKSTGGPLDECWTKREKLEK
jgi:hypothetical protein